MSRPRSERPKPPPPWECLQCGRPFHGRALREEAGRVARRKYGGGPCVLLHVCGACHARHVEAGDGTLRALTAGEQFAVELQLGRVLAAAEGGLVPVPRGGATLLLPEE